MSVSTEMLQIADAYVEDIERLVAEDFLTDALEKLLDFVRDFDPGLKREALALYANHSRVRKELKRGQGNVDELNGIVEAVLDMAERIKEAAQSSIHTVPEHTAPEAPDEEAEAPEQPAKEPDGHTLDAYRKMYLTTWRNISANSAENTLISATGMVKRYRRNDFKLGPISFELLRGEITGVVGMNASGKTTLLNIMLGRLRHEDGELEYPAFGKRRDWAKIKSYLGYVDQLPERWYGSLRHNLNHTAAAFGTVGRENQELVEWYVNRYGLRDYADATWDEISGGFKIRFELVRALLSKPRLLVLDEPLAYLDIVTQQLFLSDLRSIASSLDNPIPIVVTSQHLYEIEAVADRMIILDDGACLFSGRSSEIPEHNEYQCIEASIQADKGDVLAALRPIGLVDIEVSATSYLLFFPKSVERKEIVSSILETYGERLISFRDISRSTRVLFRNKRDEFDSHAS